MNDMINEAVGMLTAIGAIIVMTVVLKVVMDATYNALPDRARKFLDNHF